jgi:hypothetical protein
VPEEGALLVVAWLLRHDDPAGALDVLDAIAPFFDRLRFHPVPDEHPLPVVPSLRLLPASAVARGLRQRKTPPAIVAMRDALARWPSLADRATTLLVRTIEGAPLRLVRDDRGVLLRDAKGQPVVAGGTVGAQIDAAWVAEAQAFLRAMAEARALGQGSRRVNDPSESLPVMAHAIELLAHGGALSAGMQRRVRRVLATVLHKRGMPGSPRHDALRAAQRRVLEAPLTAAIATVVADRLSELAPDVGVPAVEPFVAPVALDEARPGAPAGALVPPTIVEKVRRAWEAPIETLLACGVVSSLEALADLVPQMTAHVHATAMPDEALRRVYSAVYGAFRKRRSLLLLHLERQVAFHELPWIAVLEGYRAGSEEASALARHTLETLAVLAITHHPETILPNKLLREFAALVQRAGLTTPLVEELAADIFMGTFSEKFVASAKLTARMLQGTLYERYYGLPFASVQALSMEKDARGGVPAFAVLCERLAQRSAGTEWVPSRRHLVVQNGMILEQQQLLTSHNLAALFTDLSLRERFTETDLVELARRCFRWIVVQHARHTPPGKPSLRRLKDSAYAWRQMVFFLALVGEDSRRAFVPWARAALAQAREPFRTRFRPVLEGLVMVIEGGRFDETGTGRFEGGHVRRLLGWTFLPYECFDAPM